MGDSVIEIKYNLRDMAWSMFRDWWEQSAPGTLDRVENLCEAGQRVALTSEPTKRICYGRVEIWKTATEWRAETTFHDEWPMPEEDINQMSEGITLPASGVAYLLDVAPKTSTGLPGHTVCMSVASDSFNRLLESVDTCENQLLSNSAGARRLWIARIRAVAGIP